MRIENAAKNIIVTIGDVLLTTILSMLSRYLFLVILSIEYLGISSLFSNVLTLLSFAELGIGNAIIYSLYKPLANNNEKEISALVIFFKKCYRIIGFVILIVGVFLIPFIDFIIPDKKGIENIEILYILFLFNTSISYFFSYNRSLITADQKAYKLVKVDYLFKILLLLFPIVTLYIFKEYIFYLVVQILMNVIYNVVVYIKVNQEYPFIKNYNKPKIPETTKKDLLKNTTALIIYKVAIVVTAGTDDILISFFFGLTTVGICSNYILIFKTISNFLEQTIRSITASVGNLSATQGDEKKYEIYNVLYFIGAWIYGYAAMMLIFCINPFISLWLGSDYLLSNEKYLPMILSFLTLGLQNSTSVFRDAQGLFWQGKLRPLAQAIVNIVASILLVKITNNVGAIFWGTVISRITTIVWFDPYIVFKYGLNRSVKKHYFKYIVTWIYFIMIFGFCLLLISYIKFDNKLISLFVNAALCTVIFNGVSLLLFHKTKEFCYLKMTAKRLTSKLLGHGSYNCQGL